MYYYIKGKITLVLSKYVVLDNNGVGYLIVVPNPFSFIKGEEATIYVYHYLRENEELFYGFKSEDERSLFLKLLDVNGIGPKSALSILAGASVKEIMDAIERDDHIYLKKFPGIGAKASQQIILDLKGKLKFDKNLNKNSSKLDDLTEALISLGYSRKDSRRVLECQDLSMSEESVLKSCLDMLNK